MNQTLFIFIIIFFSFKSFSKCDLGLVSSSEAQKYNYVIIPGLLNEIIPYYMTEYRRYLLALGVPDHQIIRLNNSSFLMPKENIKYMFDKISEIKNGKKIVFFSHSKGALENLYMLLKHKDDIKLKKAFLIQGPLDGISLYKLIVVEEKRGFLFSLGRKLRKISYFKRYSDSFSFISVRKNLENLSKDKKLLNKITFVETSEPYKKLSFNFKLVSRFYKNVGDGVLLKSDHIPFELWNNKSICRLYYESDHEDLVKAAPWKKSHIQKIDDFLNTLLFGFK